VLHVARWRILAVIIVALLGIIWASPNVLPASVRSALPGFLPTNGVNLGLDLQGGSHLLFEVDSSALVRGRLEAVSDDMTGALRGRRPGDSAEDRRPAIAFTGRSVSQDGTVARVTITDPAQMAEAQRRIGELGLAVEGLTGQVAASDLEITTQPGNIIEVRLSQVAVDSMTRRAVSQSIEVIRRRIDETGTREPSITRQGADRIVVQAPGESDPEALKRLIGQTAKLTFQMVDDSVSAAEAASGIVPPGSEVLPQPDEPSEPLVVVRQRAVVDGEQLVDAQPSFDQQSGAPVVTFRFNNAGARAFGATSQRNVGKRFAIILDDKVISAPVIREAILGGTGQISGNFTTESANELATLLRAGALPAPLIVQEQRTVGPTQGTEAIQAGALASVIAMVLVVGFMLLTYGFVFGGIAILALTVNLILIMASMSAVGATLTLPGIAGLILTIGAAVDANVLIYERMREEELSGRSAALSIDAGFKRAIVTVLDANITALLTALILFFFGSGPVRGFAWTLSIGVVTSLFTAILMTQVMLAWWYWTTKPKKLPV
jgi:protein-export membrane protein SecD